MTALMLYQTSHGFPFPISSRMQAITRRVSRWPRAQLTALMRKLDVSAPCSSSCWCRISIMPPLITGWSCCISGSATLVSSLDFGTANDCIRFFRNFVRRARRVRWAVRTRYTRLDSHFLTRRFRKRRPMRLASVPLDFTENARRDEHEPATAEAIDMDDGRCSSCELDARVR